MDDFLYGMIFLRSENTFFFGFNLFYNIVSLHKNKNQKKILKILTTTGLNALLFHTKLVQTKQ